MKNYLLVALILLSACTPSVAQDISEADKDTPIAVDVGEDIVISLAGNATTGYKWHFSGDNAYLYKVIGEDYVTTAHPAGMVGVGGHYVYKIKALHKGTLHITARYFRPWESYNPHTDKSYKFIFDIK